MKVLINLYKVTRSVFFSVIFLITAVYLILYILISVPAVQNVIRDVAEREASKFLGGDVRIESLSLHPFNEVVIHGLEVYGPDHVKCISVETVGAGINLMRLIKGNGIEITYGEIIGMDASVVQQTEDSPLNIRFIIEAFQPKDKNKPPTQFDINLRNVVMRKCQVTFDRMWLPEDSTLVKTDFNHLRIYDLKADVTFPQLKNDDFKIDLRRLAFKMSGGLEVEKVAFQAHVTSRSVSLTDFIVRLPSTELRPSDVTFDFDGFSDIRKSLASGIHDIMVADSRISLSDFGWLVPEFRRYPQPFEIYLDARGNLDAISIEKFSLRSMDDITMELSGSCSGLGYPENLNFDVDDVHIHLSHFGLTEIGSWISGLTPQIKKMLSDIGGLDVSASGRGNVSGGNYELDCVLSTGCGDVYISGDIGGMSKGKGTLSGEINIGSMDVARLLGKGKIGTVDATLNLSATINGKDIDGEADLYVTDIMLNGYRYGGIAGTVVKKGKDYEGNLTIDNEIASVNSVALLHVEGAQSWISAHADIAHLYPSGIGLLPNYDGYALGGTLGLELTGDNLDNVTGEVRLTDMSFKSVEGMGISLDRLIVKSEMEEMQRHITVQSDWLDGDISGNFKVAMLPGEIQRISSSVFPSLILPPSEDVEYDSDVEFSFLIKADNTLTEFFKLPIRLLVDIPVEGGIRGLDRKAFLAIDIPYLQQGKNKLMHDNMLRVDMDGVMGSVNVDLGSTFPVKRGELALSVNFFGQQDKLYSDIGWINTENSNFKGSLSIDADIERTDISSRPEVILDVNPSIFNMGSARWNVDRGRISYADNIIDVDGIKIWHDDQFVEISGVASALQTDSVAVKLADIDLDYVFETLNINYVTFGGIATGEITAYGALGKDPVALTDNLSVKGLSYNGAVLGDALIKSHWNNEEKAVTINADIRQDGKSRATIDGGIWVARDSLSFGIDADRVPVGFLSPFMSAFSSDVKGYASGSAKLFGTFSDIDLTGRILGDSIALKLDYTNTYYHGTDSVYLDPGKITIPSFRLYDRNGNSALLTGELTHRYFHDPSFTFRISDARGLLCYDTNQKMNPDWYGTIYGNGGAVVRGWPGTVSVSVDMSVTDRSAFTYVLNDTEAAADYHFLTFSDKRKAELERLSADSVPDILTSFRRKISGDADTPTRFLMDIRCSVSPSSLMTLVMDPVAGDKITARGSGAIQIDYESDSDDMQMLGKYTLTEGNYNFSLQDLILRNFTILPGSSISFNGDPLNASLDITASYRVNTNLSDLDKSFSTDPELARTNVPVDALLMVKGEMQHPDITFDIDLPTLTQDVERKVKSIISTDDMMSRQIIYLLALNRFYTPEYMGASSNGGELAAVASTTLSSQLSNMLGQLTDKFTLAPSFRSDKGDFSDLEVDVALSSRLLNNRLLVNGNFGYRDRSTSSTTFVGDFDIEYLLKRSGNLRLKAYNHFNDQNYYLREALTTQGLGVVYRMDFDNPFTFLKRERTPSDTVKRSMRNEGGGTVINPDSVVGSGQE